VILRTLLLGVTRFLLGGQAYWLGTRPSPRQRIYFANHASNADTVVLWAALPPELRRVTHPVAAADYWSRSRLRRHLAFDVLRAVLIERGGGREALEPLHETLRAGESLIFFPEGGRTATPLPGPFKTGLYHLAAAHPEVELVPVYLENVGRALPKGAVIPIPMSAAVVFGTPIHLGTGEPRDAFLARAREAVVALAHRLHPEPAPRPDDAEEAGHA
jgi:1-acyl-sn-glycerol-3-phosphate acyltransferase